MADPNFLRRIKELAIIAIFSDDEFLDRLVLKGGNLLDVVYGLSARASVDVDFSMDGEFDDIEELKRRAKRTLETTFAEYGYRLLDFSLISVPPKMTDDIKDFWGGYKLEFKIIDKDRYKAFEENAEQLRRNAASIGKRGSTKFKIDISRHEFCDEKQPYWVDDFRIFGYSPAMFVAEKLRALCQQMPEYVALVQLNPRPRARDFLDIFVVSRHYSIDWAQPEFRSTVRKTFEKKRVPLKLLGDLPNVREQHAENFQSVRDTVKVGYDLQDFDFYFEYVCNRLSGLETLWNE